MFLEETLAHMADRGVSLQPSHTKKPVGEARDRAAPGGTGGGEEGEEGPRLDLSLLAPEVRRFLERHDPDQIDLKLVVEMVLHICDTAEDQEKPGAVLVFLPVTYTPPPPPPSPPPPPRSRHTLGPFAGRGGRRYRGWWTCFGARVPP